MHFPRIVPVSWCQGAVFSLGQGVTMVQKVELEQLSTDRRISSAALKHYRQSFVGKPESALERTAVGLGEDK